jgi:aryl-alcohol dehydrogenase
MAARLCGLSDIVAVDLNPERRRLALELGATRALDGADPDLVAAIRQGGHQVGDGVDFSFDTTGVSTVMVSAIEVLRRPGVAVLVGAGLEMLTVHPAFLAGKSVTYVYEGDSLPQIFIPRLIELYQRGVFPFDRLIRHYRLDEIDLAEADAIAGRAVKPVLLMG